LVSPFSFVEKPKRESESELSEDDPVVTNYKKLNAKIVPLDKGSELYKTLEQ
jgi:hypothetical protein